MPDPSLAKAAHQPMLDWTAGESGASNTSAQYQDIVCAVERLIRSDAHKLINGQAGDTARLIVSHLAHRYGMAPAGNAEHRAGDSGP
jgi:hypothetical protein